MFYRCFFILIMCMLAGSPIWGADSYTYKTLSIDEGLSQSNVLAMLRDSRGYLWIGTKFGLNLYDNNRITNYYHSDDSNSIPDNEIRLIWEDGRERVWVAGAKGVSVFDRVNNEFSPVTRPDGRPLNIRSVYQAPGTMVMGGVGMLFSYDEDADTVTEIPAEGAPNVFFTGIYPRSDTNWLLSTRWGGIYSYNPQIRKAEKVDFTDAREITALAVDSQGYIWVSEYGEGVKCYDHFGHLRGEISLRKLGYETDIVLDIHDHGDEVWLATDGAGIIVIDKSSMSLRRLCKDIFSGHSLAVNDLYEDAFGNTYAGTVRDGAMMIFPTAMRTYSTLLTEQSDLIVTSIAPCGDKVFFGSDGAGVLTFDADNDGFVTIPSTRGMKVTSISPVDDTTLLVATYEKGFFLLDVASGRLSPAPKILSEIVAANSKKGLSYKLWTVGDGRIVIVTDRVYLCDFNSNKYSAVALNGNIRQDEAMKPFGHMDDTLWLFTAKGVYKMSLAKLAIDKFFELPVEEDIKCADFDEQGNIFVSTDKSLFHIDAETGVGRQIEGAPGRINTIVVDGDDMWLGADNTLYRRSISSGRLTKFNQYDGVRPNEFLGRPVLVDSDYIMIGGINGLLKINKPQLNAFDNRPRQDVNISLAEILVDGESMFRSLKDGGVLDISDNHTTIELRIIDSEPTPMRNKTFRYHIESDSKQWDLESENRYLQLSMLPHGSTYHVSVACSTPDGGWTAPTEIVAIKVRSPWWLSWWAFLLYSVAIFVVVVIIVNHRKNVLNKRKNAKERHMLEKEVGFMVNINHELRTPLSLIYGPLLKLTKQLRERNADKEVIDEMSKIASQAEKMRGVINMSMEAWRTRGVSSPENIKKQPLNEWVKELVSEFDNAAEVKHQKFEVSLAPDAEIATYDRGRLTVVMNNIITYAMKYSPQGASIQVATFTDGSKIGVRVSKQANGVTRADIPALFSQYSAEDSGHFGSGLGLAYAKVIVEMYGGAIRAFLNADGSILTVEVALAQSFFIAQNVAPADTVTDLGVAASNKHTKTIDQFNASALTAFVVVKDPEIGNYIVAGLKPRFKSVVYISDSHQALMQIRNVLPDIVITSYSELCSQIKDAPDLKHIPVVLLTSGDSEKDKDTAYRVGADRYVSTPFEMETLMSRCSNLLYTRSILKERYKSESSPVIKENAANNADETFLMRVNEIIVKNLQNPDFSVNTIVDKMLMSRSALYTRFKELSGESLGNYIQDIRLAKAKDMLADISLPISEISDLLGFSSQRYFSTFFKGKTGVTPSQWRANLSPQE